MFLGCYPITPASPILHQLSQAQGIRRHHLPGRGRDRRDLRGDRRVLCRPARRHLVVGPGHRAQGRGDGPRDHDRTAAGHRQLAARRAVDRPADQDRAVRPLSGGLWPQRRCAARRSSPRARPSDCFECRDRGGAARGPVHDAGDAADRRLYRQCRRALARARHGVATQPFPVTFFDRGRRPRARLNPYQRDAETLRAAVDQARHARPDPPHRRHREGLRHRRHRLRARPTTRR